MSGRYVASGLIVAGSMLASGSALAQSFCYVSDPTGTPLNIRIEPHGRVVGAIRNGTQVTIAETRSDERGRPWVFIRGLDDNRGIGWVYRDFLNC